MGRSGLPSDLQDAVERSYRAQWGGRRFCAVTAVVLFVLSVFSAVLFAVARKWVDVAERESALRVIETSALSVSFVFLVVAVLLGLEALIRWQREQGQVPDRMVHWGLVLSSVTLAGLLFLGYLFLTSWVGSGIGEQMFRISRFVVFLFCGLVWLGSVILNSAAVALVAAKRSDLLEVNATDEGTALLVRKGQSTEIVKLTVGCLISFITFAVAMILAGTLVAYGVAPTA